MLLYFMYMYLLSVCVIIKLLELHQAGFTSCGQLQISYDFLFKFFGRTLLIPNLAAFVLSLTPNASLPVATEGRQ